MPSRRMSLEQALAAPPSRWRSCRRPARRAPAAWARSPARARSPAGAGRRRRGACARSLARLCDADVFEQLVGALLDRALLGARRARCAGSRPARRRAVRTWRPIITFSSADRLANRRMFWNVRAMPRAATSCGFWSASGRPSNTNSPRVRRVDAGQHVEQAGLAGAVGPDQAVDLAVVDREADVGERLHAAEALADATGAQQDEVVVGHYTRAAASRARACAAPTAGGRPGGTASSAPAPGRTAACGSPRARSASGRTAPSAPARRCSAAPPGTNESSTRAEDHAPDVAHAAQHHHRQHHHRLDQDEALRADEALDRGEHAAGDAAERRAHREREQLDVAWC